MVSRRIQQSDVRSWTAMAARGQRADDGRSPNGGDFERTDSAGECGSDCAESGDGFDLSGDGPWRYAGGDGHAWEGRGDDLQGRAERGRDQWRGSQGSQETLDRRGSAAGSSPFL